MCVQSQVSALTLLDDITVHQYQVDNSERCHTRRAKALWDHTSPRKSQLHVFVCVRERTWAILEDNYCEKVKVGWLYTSVFCLLAVSCLCCTVCPKAQQHLLSWAWHYYENRLSYVCTSLLYSGSFGEPFVRGIHVTTYNKCSGGCWVLVLYFTFNFKKENTFG